MMKKPMGKGPKMMAPPAPAPKGGKLKEVVLKTKIKKALGKKK